jgi:hypothetical protein
MQDCFQSPTKTVKLFELAYIGQAGKKAFKKLKERSTIEKVCKNFIADGFSFTDDTRFSLSE